jgi:hypothetical protein
MPTPLESRAALKLITGAAVTAAETVLQQVSGSPQEKRLQLLDTVPGVIDYYADGSSALAVDFYEDERQQAGALEAYSAQMVVNDRTVKIRRAIAWAAEPMFSQFDEAQDSVSGRLAEIVQLESARPYRDTITGNRQNDPASVGWKRITSGGCAFCQMLAARGAVYSEASVHFASHPHCHCTAAPVFRGGETGPEASVIQYTASRKNRTPAQRAQLRDYLNSHFGGE